MDKVNITPEEVNDAMKTAINNAGIFDGRVVNIEKINDSEEIKKLLASKIEDDIQQYLPDISAIWGNERVSVKIKDDIAYAVWSGHWMPTIDFYGIVAKNSGVVEPKDFERY